MKTKKIIIFLVSILIFFTFSGENYANSQPLIYLLQLNGIINPITSQYVINGIEDAEKENAECLILQLDTPGGLFYIYERYCKENVKCLCSDCSLCFSTR